MASEVEKSWPGTRSHAGATSLSTHGRASQLQVLHFLKGPVHVCNMYHMLQHVSSCVDPMRVMLRPSVNASAGRTPLRQSCTQLATKTNLYHGRLLLSDGMASRAGLESSGRTASRFLPVDKGMCSSCFQLFGSSAGC